MKYFLPLLIPFIIQGQSGYEIARSIDLRPAPKDLTNKTNMILKNSKGKTRNHVMISKSMDNNAKQIIWFLEPKDDRGVAFLKIEHDKKEDEMRMWLPAFKKVRRISAKKKGDAFMGSDLSYEDLSSRDLDENEYERLDDEKWENRECFVLKTIPKIEIRSSYSKHVSWVDKATFTIVKEHSFNKRGKLEKEKKFGYEKRGEYQLIKRVFVKDASTKHTTEILFTDIKVDSGIKNNLFHEKNLKRLPND